ncbi:MAG TPA: nucleoside monophosphate kinase, partial [Patescibacteria group bacterium]|nr:nucleoside monophosphate kinase [Patescibacteria group bacterium]
KDTQADFLLEAHPNGNKLSPGGLIREVRDAGESHRFWPIIGPHVATMEQGIKIPDEPVVEGMSRLAKESIAQGRNLIIFAGYPRSFIQLNGITKLAQETGAQLLFMHINVTDVETYHRVYHRNDGRVDDDPDIHTVRLDEFEKHVVPMMEKLRSEGRVIDIDGMQPKDIVFKQVENELRQHILDPEVTLPFMARR